MIGIWGRRNRKDLVRTFINKSITFYKNNAQIADNLGWLFFDKVLRMGVGLIVGVWVARYLGVQDFGALNYAMAIVAITGVFATMGIESLVVKKLTQIISKLSINFASLI